MIHSLLPWSSLTRFGTPEFEVAGRPIRVGEVEFPVGAAFPASVLPNRVRLRQLYEQRRIQPVDPPPNTRQFLAKIREKQGNAAEALTAGVDVQRDTIQATIGVAKPSCASVQPTSPISVGVPVPEEPNRTGGVRKGYRPANRGDRQ